jgi:dyslexia susceptibility 1 candidate gene 1 protein
MPLTGDYTWTETATILKLTIPLHNSAPSSVDLVCSSLFIKVSFEQYLIHIDLHGQVDDGQKGSKAVVKNGVLSIKVVKVDKGVWGRLEVEGKESGSLSKQDLSARREESLEKMRSKLEAMHERAKEVKIEEERGQVRKQMALEQAERQAIDDLKATEKEKAEREVYERFNEIKVEEAKKAAGAVVPKAEKVVKFAPKKEAKKAKKKYEDDDDFDDDIDMEEEEENQETSPSGSGGDEIWDISEVQGGSENPSEGFDLDRDALDDDDIDEEEEGGAMPPAPPAGDEIVDDDELDGSDVPAPRNSVRTTFKYTPRLFKTPARESTIPTEKEFVAKNRPHLHNHGLLNKEALDVSESDPTWLKGKGDDLFRNGDYLSAINAYSSAYEASPTMLPALSNRAACYLKIGEPARCIADCDDALRVSTEKQGLLADVPGGVGGFWLKLFVRR